MNKQYSVRALSRALNLSSHTFCLTTPPSSSSTFPLKNVKKSNFESSLEDLRRHVRGSDFVAVDLEMNGITSAPWRESFEFDRFNVRYLKVKDSAEKFAIVQFGVCPFRWDSSKQSFVAHPGQEDEALRHLDLAYEDELSESWRNSKEIKDIPLVSKSLRE